ncbi:eCIS core domain-containing protein [Roseobacteraceae bacterium S113]
MVKRRIRRKAKRRAAPLRHGTSQAAQLQSREGGGLMIGGALDPAEKAADALASRALSGAKAAGTGAPAPSGGGNNGGGAVQRKCAACAGEEDKVKRAAPATTVAAGAKSAPAGPAISSAVSQMGAGRAMTASERGYFEPRFARDFASVRVHDGPAGDKAARAMDANAFAHGRDIAFAKGAKDTGTMAHELAHVVQNDGAAPLQRDLAVTPPNEGAEVATLDDDQRADAQLYNRRRFEDPFSISIARDVMGIPKWPAVIDEAFLDATLRWQADHGLTQDGKMGPDVTATLVTELMAENETRLAQLLQLDNFVKRIAVSGPNKLACGTDPGGFNFQYYMRFETSLRNGFIVQRIQNVWNETTLPPGQGAVTQAPLYWEAWSVNGAGTVAPSATQDINGNSIGTYNDMWTRRIRPGSAGNWSMRGKLYTVLNLPGVFAANSLPDAGILQATTSLTSAQIEGLGLPEGYRAIEIGDEREHLQSGTWDCRAAASPQFNN